MTMYTSDRIDHEQILATARRMRSQYIRDTFQSIYRAVFHRAAATGASATPA